MVRSCLCRVLVVMFFFLESYNQVERWLIWLPLPRSLEASQWEEEAWGGAYSRGSSFPHCRVTAGKRQSTCGTGGSSPILPCQPWSHTTACLRATFGSHSYFQFLDRRLVQSRLVPINISWAHSFWSQPDYSRYTQYTTAAASHKCPGLGSSLLPILPAQIILPRTTFVLLKTSHGHSSGTMWDASIHTGVLVCVPAPLLWV